MRRIIIASLSMTISTFAVGAAGFAADLPEKAPPPPPPQAWSWGGYYGGVNIGYSIADVPVTESSFSVAFGTYLSNTAHLAVSGVIGGGQVGYNWQLAPNWLIGIETDFQGSDQRGSGTFTEQVIVAGADTVAVRNDWLGTVRPRLGYIQDNTNVWYVTGGYAYGRNEVSLSAVNGSFALPTAGTTTTSHSGWTVGGGVESHLIGNWTGKIEYLYVDLGTILGTSITFIAPGVVAAGIVASERFHDNIMRAGINYKF